MGNIFGFEVHEGNLLEYNLENGELKLAGVRIGKAGSGGVSPESTPSLAAWRKGKTSVNFINHLDAILVWDKTPLQAKR